MNLSLELPMVGQSSRCGCSTGPSSPQLEGGFAALLQGGQGDGSGLSEWLQQQEISPDQLDPQMLAALQHWLADGNALPMPATSMLTQQQELPLAARLRQLAEQLQTAVPAQSEGAELQDLPDLATAQEAELPSASRLAFSDASALPKLTPGQDPSLLAALPGQQVKPLPEVLSQTTLPESISAEVALEDATGMPNSAAQVGLPKGFSAPVANQLLAMHVAQPVGAQNWDRAVGERLMWMVKGDQQFAELKVTPPNLGSLEVKLTINHDQASVSFVSHHPAVRDALEAAIPRLREMLGQESINLANVDVSGGQRESSSGQAQAQDDRATEQPWQDAESEEPVVQAEHSLDTTPMSGLGMVDYFA